MLIDAGKESEFSKEELKPLNVTKNLYGEISSFPSVAEGWHVACAFNQWGMAGMAKMIICQDLADMKELVNKYKKGFALEISWYSIPDTHFVKIVSLEEWAKDSKKEEPTVKKAKL